SKIVPHRGLTLAGGAIHPWKNSSNTALQSRLLRFANKHNISVDIPWMDLDTRDRERILLHSEPGYSAVIPWFKLLERKRHKMHVRVLLSRYRSQFLCQTCSGGRLRPEALCFRIGGWSLAEVWDSPIYLVSQWLVETQTAFEEILKESQDLQAVFARLTSRLNYLLELGLPYITLGRPSRTLSGGETQRVNLTTALGSELVSTHFVLDEPSVGLHPRDTERLLRAIRKLQQSGNTVTVVEHDLECIEGADRVLELGPEAGTNGGQVIYSGEVEKWPGIAEREAFFAPRNVPSVFPLVLSLRNANARNLKNLNVDIPVGFFTTLTGVSGSGKSTLVTEELLQRWSHYTQTQEQRDTNGFEHFHNVLLVDQSGLTKSPRANIATYSGIWDIFRNEFAATAEAEQRSLTKSSFSFNVEGGRCTNCKGAGYLREDMQFLSDVYVQCEECLGKRFQAKVLEVPYRDKNISQWLS
ncbi:MAG: hypothetical protein KDD60_11520, partial [Bdellovibrionales bacterium]|nr:hypothetical protein [Bdellovibrionales bacterium]